MYDKVENNPCKHCRKYKRTARHPHLPEEKCYFNKKWKGCRPQYVCAKIEIKFRKRDKFPVALGGTAEDETSDEESKWRRGPENNDKILKTLSKNSDWIKINKGKTKNFAKKNSVHKKPSYIHLSNAYAKLPDFSADPPIHVHTTRSPDGVTHDSISMSPTSHETLSNLI